MTDQERDEALRLLQAHAQELRAKASWSRGLTDAPQAGHYEEQVAAAIDLLARVQPQGEPIYRCEHCNGPHIRRTLAWGWICETCHRSITGPVNWPVPPAQATPEGWQLAPKEPTPAMMQEMWEVGDGDLYFIRRKRCYANVLAAAPKPGGKDE